MKRLFALAAAGLVLMGIDPCRRASSAGPQAVAPATAPANSPEASSDGGGVRSITLPQIDPGLPPGPGRFTVQGTCSLCHSPRYITNQPPLTRATWTAEVDKMRKTFGAPVTDEQAKVVVDYAVSVRGADEPATKPSAP